MNRKTILKYFIAERDCRYACILHDGQWFKITRHNFELLSEIIKTFRKRNDALAITFLQEEIKWRQEHPNGLFSFFIGAGETSEEQRINLNMIAVLTSMLALLKPA